MKLSSRVSGLRPYIPGEQPADRVYVKLNANESPYPPSPAVENELRGFRTETLRLYPDPDSRDLRKAIAGMPGMDVTPDMVFPGNGSDEVLSFIFCTFFDPSLPVVFPQYSYSFYPVYAGFYHLPVRTVPLRPDFSLDTGTMAQSGNAGVIFPNPNAPTGILLETSGLRAFLQQQTENNPGRAVVVDEAYIDFGGESALPLLREFPELIIVRTFSKSFSFAGLRLGYAVSSPENIRALETVKNSFNHFPVDRIAQRLGIAACSDAAYYRRVCAEIAATRDQFSAGLQKAGWQVLPSKANFVFARCPGRSGQEVYEAAKKEGFLLRVFGTPGTEDFVRITIGTPQDMRTLLECLEKYCAAK